MNESHLLFTGTQVNYFFICKTKLWFFSHSISLEQESELVELGKFLHEIMYGREERNLKLARIAVDFVRKGDILEVHEVKKSSKLEKAHVYQLLYYLYVIRKETGLKAVGFLHYPKLNKVKRVELRNEKEIEDILKEIKKIISLPAPPKPVRKSYCKSCAYYELCFG